MPVIPDCQGRLYSRFGSQFGCRRAGTRFEMFGIALLSSFSTQPLRINSDGKRELSVITMMSRSIDWPRESGPWIFPKYCEFELMSSTYSVETPYFFLNSSRVGWRFVFSSTSM